MLELIITVLQLVTLLTAFVFGVMSLSHFTDDHPLYTGKIPRGFIFRPWRFKQYWRPPGYKYSMYSTFAFLANGILIVAQYLLDLTN